MFLGTRAQNSRHTARSWFPPSTRRQPKKRDVEGYVRDATIYSGGGALVGEVFSHVGRGFGIGMVGSAVYVAAKRGKDVQLPAQTELLARL
ncbi:MAG: hypothetical protein WBE86_05360, partial [Candidatus Acidiferrales bacterium]